MKTKNNKFGTATVILAMILTAALIIALALNVGNKTRVVYVPAPDSASSDFSGTMLSDYNNVTLAFNSHKFIFDFDDVSLNQYEFIVLDILDSKICNDDLCLIHFGPILSSDSELMNGHTGDPSLSAENQAGPYFKYVYGSINDFTYVFDLRSLEDGVLKLVTYLNGVFSYEQIIEGVSSDVSLMSFTIDSGTASITYDNYVVDALYLYGFEDSSDCSIGDYLADHSLNLTDCKDSLLYQGE